MSSEREKLVQFQTLTGAPEHVSRAFLDARNWDVEVLLSHRTNAHIRLLRKTSLIPQILRMMLIAGHLALRMYIVAVVSMQRRVFSLVSVSLLGNILDAI